MDSTLPAKVGASVVEATNGTNAPSPSGKQNKILAREKMLKTAHVTKITKSLFARHMSLIV